MYRLRALWLHGAVLLTASDLGKTTEPLQPQITTRDSRTLFVNPQNPLRNRRTHRLDLFDDKAQHNVMLRNLEAARRACSAAFHYPTLCGCIEFSQRHFAGFTFHCVRSEQSTEHECEPLVHPVAYPQAFVLVCSACGC